MKWREGFFSVFPYLISSIDFVNNADIGKHFRHLRHILLLNIDAINKEGDDTVLILKV